MLVRDVWFGVLVGVAFSSGGCASLGGGQNREAGGLTSKGGVAVLDPTRVGVVGDPCLGTGVYDAVQLLEAGYTSFNESNFERARSCFFQVVNDFPGDLRRNTALYNLGVTNLRLKRLSEAEAALVEMLALAPLHQRADDARLELGLLYLEKDEYKKARAELMAVTESPNGEPYLGIRAMALLGRASIAEREYVMAEDHLWRAFHWYRRAERAGDYVDSHLMGTILFHQAGIKERLMEDAVVVPPKDNSEEEHDRSFKSLEVKASWLIDAQNGYLRVIRVGNRYWATAAGYKIGAMYESLHRHLTSVPVPQELTEEEGAVYQEEVRKKLAVLLRKSVRVFKKVCGVAKRLNLSNQWVRSSEDSLARLMATLEATVRGRAAPVEEKAGPQAAR